MNYDQDLAIYIPEGDFTPFHGLPTPPTEPTSSNQSNSDPPTHKSLTPLDRVGVSSHPIGPKRRQRRSVRTPQQQARSVARRNARERKRVKLVNLGFATLRDHIPPHLGLADNNSKPKSTPSNNGKASNNNKKLSKVETLRCAIEYIRQLREAVGYDDKDLFDDKDFCLNDDKEMFDDKDGSVEDFSPAGTSSSSCNSPGVMMTSPSLFGDEDGDDFFNIVDWTTL